MKKLNFLSLGMASLGSIAALGIATAPAQAQFVSGDISTLE